MIKNSHSPFSADDIFNIPNSDKSFFRGRGQSPRHKSLRGQGILHQLSLSQCKQTIIDMETKKKVDTAMKDSNIKNKVEQAMEKSRRY